MKVDGIIAVLPKLSAADRSKVRAALEILDDGSGEVTNGAVVWQMIRAAAERQGVKLPPWSAVSKMRLGPRIERDSRGVLEFAENAFEPRDKTERTQALMVCARALLAFLAQCDLPWTTTTIAGNLQNMSAAVDASYPGYVRHGVMRQTLGA